MKDSRPDYATITSSLFEEDYFQSYCYLTEQFQFNTIPMSVNQKLDGIDQYVIDFSYSFHVLSTRERTSNCTSKEVHYFAIS